MIIYLVRHLKTRHNIEGIYMGRSGDLPIEEKEVSFFKQTIGKVSVKPFEGERILFYSSPAQRCQQTAKILIDTIDPKAVIHTDDALHETNYGLFEGKKIEEIKVSHPDVFKQWMESPSHVHFPEGESYAQVQERVISFLQQIIKLHEGNVSKLVIVTHVDVIKVIISWVLGIPIDNKRLFCIDNGTFSQLETTDEKYNVKKIKVRSLNVS